jgi:hypothetical protein
VAAGKRNEQWDTLFVAMEYIHVKNPLIKALS